MDNFRFTLEQYNGLKSRFSCPLCRKQHTFTRYIDNETGNYIAENVGRCNREINCGYHYTPKQFYCDNPIQKETLFIPNLQNRIINSKPKKPVSFIPYQLFEQSLKNYEENNFVQFITNQFGKDIAQKQIEKYFIGSSKYWQGANVFWQIDISGKIRTGKIMLYNPKTGKRIRDNLLPVYWVHKAIKQPEFNLSQCFFGEHLLKSEKEKTIGIVESEKTAILSSIFFPELVWLACGSLNNLSVNKMKSLTGRNVILFPDLNCFEKWKVKANDFSNIANIKVSNFLERKASENEKRSGLDIADFLCY